jgi:hypothetical protein
LFPPVLQNRKNKESSARTGCDRVDKQMKMTTLEEVAPTGDVEQSTIHFEEKSWLDV